jgi:hypothetical protein
MSEENEGAARFEKGDRAAVVSGPKDVGVRGQVFWVGENKFGPGLRYGLRGDDGETYWVDEANIGPEEGAPPAPEPPPADEGPVLSKGTRVEITGGRQGKGETGEIFWAGESKFGPGMRYGIRGEGDASWWVDGKFVKALEEQPADAPAASAPPPEDAPLPDPDEFADFADEAPPDDAPFPPDDIPF